MISCIGISMEDKKLVGFSFFFFYFAQLFYILFDNSQKSLMLKSLDLASKIWAVSLYNMIYCIGIGISMEDNIVYVSKLFFFFFDESQSPRC